MVTHFSTLLGFPSDSKCKESACNAGELGLIPGLGRTLGEGNGFLLWYSFPGEFHEQRSLEGYRPWVTESDMIEQLTDTHKIDN